MQLPRVAELNWKLATDDNWQQAVAWCEVCQNGKSWQLRMQSGPLPGWGSMLDDSSTADKARRDEARWGRRMRGCPAINRHKNKLQLPSMNKFHCNLLCIPFFHPRLHMCLPPQQHLPHGWPPKRHLKFSFINRSQSGAAFLCVLDLVGARVGARVGVGVGFGVGLFGFSFHFVSIFHSVSLRVSNVVLLPFVRIYCLYHSDCGRGRGSSIHKLSVCVCVCAVLFAKFIDLETICVCCLSFLGLSMIFFGIPVPDTTTHTQQYTHSIFHKKSSYLGSHFEYLPSTKGNWKCGSNWCSN